MNKIFIAFSFWVLAFSLTQATIVNDEILVTLTLNTEGKSINALAGEIIIPESFNPLEILDGDSIINFWIEPPRFEEQRLIFSGMIPGGYNGPAGKFLKFVLQGNEKLTRLNVKSLTALLNDGQGTKTTAKITWQANSRQSEIADTIPPETFTAVIGRTPDLFNNQWFVSFATQDKQSGVDYYEVAEGRDWVKTDSPYQLLDQTGQSNIFIRATDRSGNQRLTKIIRFHWYQSVWVWIIIISILCVIFLGSRFLHSRRP